MLALIAIAGAAGTLARYLIGVSLARQDGGFPFATLLVNVVGSLILGVLVAWPPSSLLSPTARTALTIGFCGGFTTFSAFSYETVAMIQSGAHRRALLYVTASVVLSLAATAAGLAASRHVTSAR